MPGHRKRRQFKQTDAFTRGMVIGLKRAGWSIRQIAADTHLGASTVHRLWRRWLEQGNVAIYRNVGATRVTSARVDRRILRQAVAAPQATCTAILQHVQDTLDHSISTRTISRRLVANGLHSCRPLRRLPLTPPNRRQRLEWCRARSTWMTEWHRVVFSDESRFCLSSDSRRVSVWRRRGERSNPAAIVERPTVRQRGIMVWGATTYDSRSPLLRIQGTMTAQRYVDDVLRPVTLPYLQGVLNALYQQDNARPHTARISQQALQDVQMLPWPPYSPDLSPIEHVWDIIGRRLHALPQPRSEDELWQMVEREWRAIPQDAIRTLIDSLPRRVAACIAVRAPSTYCQLVIYRNLLVDPIYSQQQVPWHLQLTISLSLVEAQEAARLGKKVAVLDFVKPTPLGTTWGLGGTCVNVGCIPKKLYHQAALLGTAIKDARAYGWEIPEEGIHHNWPKLSVSIEEHIKSLNWGYRLALRNANVSYINGYAKFLDPQTIEATLKNGKVQTLTAKDIIISTGERPRYPDIPGAKEYGVTRCGLRSDDLFFLKESPGRTLVIGASYVALECAGFLRGLGLDVTLMVRSIFLRGFDQEMANKVAEHLREEEGVKIVQPCVPTRVEKVEKGVLKVYGRRQGDNEEEIGTFNTVVFAIGRDPCTSDLGLDKVGVKLNSAGRVIVDEAERTSVPNIYAIGDIIDRGLQLTPVAIKAGLLLANRLYGSSKELMDYQNVPTTVFTPLEYGCCGLTEDEAVEKYGADKIEVYHICFQPFEWAVPQRGKNGCYVKLICHIPDNERVVGLHYLGPQAGEVVQGYSLSMRRAGGATKADFDKTIGIHPTSAEQYVSLNITKRSGLPPTQKGCCG
ncbi:TXNRD1 [Cordylochernes scorpioides]|uniref:thioredoxin-disulfide reductase (NADPH) n=1 Tax=Cordylochernes scorpioides TaxID=51811 RepID=A0ABY6LRA2_9ARAC|nr:TXNRD1 [Cordylochernes scorpioides]